MSLVRSFARSVAPLGAVFALVAPIGHARPARAQRGEVCIAPSVEDALSRCEHARPSTEADARSERPTSHLPAPIVLPAATGAARSGPAPQLAPDRATGDTASRSLPILEREIQTLERITRRLDPADPRGADYLFRLAESHFEAQRQHTSAARQRDQAIFEAERRGDTPQRDALRREQSASESAASASREGAIRAWTRLLTEHPTFARADEVLYSLGAALEELAQHERARQVYLRLVRDHPQSRFVPHAWLAFGEHYFQRGDMDAARQFYERVLETPAEQNPLFGFALYKLAWVHYNLEDFRGALEQFTRVLSHAREHPEAHDAAALSRQARRELVLPYARVGQPSRALAFFRRQTSSEPEALEMLESLAELYTDTGQWPESLATHHLLMAEAPESDHLCLWQSRVTGAVIASRPKPEQVTEITRLLDVSRAFAARAHPEADVVACRVAAARAAYETAVAWHREAIGTEQQPGTRDRRTLALAAALYEQASRVEGLETLEFPDIERADWPTRARIAYARAELAYATEDWHACGPAFDRVVELEPEGALAEDAAYASALCYDRTYQSDYAAREAEVRADPGAPRALTELEQHMLASFHRFTCIAPASADLPQVQYRRARVYYEANRFEEAAPLFRTVALEHPDHELAVVAANLYLDSLNGLLRRDGRASCRDTLASALGPLEERQCRSEADRDAHGELCTVIEGLHCGLERQRAEALSAAGRHREAAGVYVSLFRERGSCPDLDEVLYDAALEFEAARLLGRAIRVRQVLVDRFPTSGLVRPALYQLGANHHALALYGQAATYYEAYARRFPDDDGSTCPPAERDTDRCPRAFAALENAVFFRMGLGEEDRAIEDARLYERGYRRLRPRETAQVVFSLGAIHERRGDWPRAYAHYHAFLRDYGRSALPHQVVRAHVQLGRAQWESGRHDEAMPHFRAAESAWARLATTETDTPLTDDQALSRARAAEAASEALFYLGERAYDDFVAVRFPRYAGPATFARVTRWSGESLGPWLARKVAALRAAEAAYARIEPLGIPEWRIAAAARVGQMYQRIVDDVRSAPVPDDIAGNPELLDTYETTLDSVLDGSSAGEDGLWETSDDIHCPDPTSAAGESADEAPPPSCQAAPIARALAAYEHCLGLATRVRWFNRWSTQCEAALNDMARARYPLAAELRGAATYSPETLAPPGDADVSAGGSDALEPSSGDEAGAEATPVDRS
jgi:tetratricopeptide (TPR) repeat protein